MAVPRRTGIVPVHSYAKTPPGAKLYARGYSLERCEGKEYLVKAKFYTAGDANPITYDIMGEARFGIVIDKGEKAAGERMEARLRSTRALADAIRRASNLPVEEPSGNLFYKPIPRSIAGNAVKEQMIEAMFFRCFLSDLRSDALYLAWDGPHQEKYLNFLAYKMKPEEIFKS